MDVHQHQIQPTADGSNTLFMPGLGETYHSKHGALQEALHVFIQAGFHATTTESLRILEIGWGTGLNALLTWAEAHKTKRKVSYTGVEAYPVPWDLAQTMNYPQWVDVDGAAAIFEQMHLMPWGKKQELDPHFSLEKQQMLFEEIQFDPQFDMVYFDAFGARVQPWLWEQPIFEKMYTALVDGGVLVTYAAKGSVRRAMIEVGFLVERLPGPPGKREMLRAIKPI
jgi:tRNA U34 5-methylaminomethyl-2-thiouridine-forming methyltransferase MnmC